jgi:hypothetical protein
MLLTFDFAINLDVSMIGNNITLNSTVIPSSIAGTAVLVNSAIGNVNATLFQDILDLAIGEVPIAVPLVSFQIPSNFTVATPFTQYATDVFEFGAATFSYVEPIPSITCPADSHVCPLGATCCPWGDVISFASIFLNFLDVRLLRGDRWCLLLVWLLSARPYLWCLKLHKSNQHHRNIWHHRHFWNFRYLWIATE